MKLLLLHWLRWDLYRFRLPLFIWALLVVAFAGYVGWLHLNLLNVPHKLPSLNEQLAVALWTVEFFLLLNILTTDPPEGARAFWKTRPPTGFAVAGAKLILVLTFFLILPLLAQQGMRVACGLTGEWYYFLHGRMWWERTWWAECLMLSVVCLVASGARNAGHALARLAAAAAVLAVPVMLSMMAGWNPGSRLELWIRHARQSIYRGFLNPTVVTCWLAVSVAVFLAMRRTRTPSRLGRLMPAIVPGVSLMAGMWFADDASASRLAESRLPALPAETVNAVKIGGPLLRGGVTTVTHEFEVLTAPRLVSAPMSSFALRLHVAGLPPDCVANAGWRSIRLIHPAGQTLEASPSDLPRGFLPRIDHDPDFVMVGSARFQEPKMLPFSGITCRVEGMLHFEVMRRRQTEIPVTAGQRVEMANETLVINGGRLLPKTGVSGGDLLTFADISRGPASGGTFWIRDTQNPERHLKLFRQFGEVWGVFMEYSRLDGGLDVSGIGSRFATGELDRAAAQGSLTNWRIGIRWLEPAGMTDIPVTLENVMIPFQLSDSRNFETVYAGFAITPQMSVSDTERTLRGALAMPGFRSDDLHDVKRERARRALAGCLAGMVHAQLPVLIKLLEDEPAREDETSEAWYEGPIQERMAALLEQAEIEGFRRDHPELYHWVRPELEKQRRLSPGEARSLEWRDISPDDLYARWKRQKFQERRFLNTEILAVALQRGLSWAPPELLELSTVTPGESRIPFETLRTISECPAASKGSVLWLRANASRLVWNPAVSRWEVPGK